MTLLRRFAILLLLLPLFSCSFDYGGGDGSDKSLPDIVMEDVEYVRVRQANPQARFQAELAERYEERRIMELQNFSFEQFGNRGADVNAFGRAGNASVEIDSGDIRLENNVRIDVESEDIAIETRWLEWKDNARTLSGGEGDEVHIFQENGTVFTGIGFHADARARSWEFVGEAAGTYIHDDEEDETATPEEAAVDGGTGAEGAVNAGSAGEDASSEKDVSPEEGAASTENEAVEPAAGETDG